MSFKIKAALACVILTLSLAVKCHGTGGQTSYGT